MQTKDFIVMYPHRRLRPYIADYMLTCPAVMPERQMIMPTASSTLVYSIGTRGIHGGLRGVNTRPVEIAGYARQFPVLLLIEFHPGGLFPFTGADQAELADDGFAFRDLSCRLDTMVCEILQQSESVQELCIRLDGIFSDVLETAAVRPEFYGAVDEIVRSSGRISTKALSEEVYYSERHLNRLFRQYLGTGVKLFSRIVRANHALDLTGRCVLSVEELAGQCGYYDASHLVRELQTICGITPREYRENMSIFYNDPFKL